MSILSTIVIIVVACAAVGILFAGAIFAYIIYKKKLKKHSVKERVCYIDNKEYVYTEHEGIMYFKSKVDLEKKE